MNVEQTMLILYKHILPYIPRKSQQPTIIIGNNKINNMFTVCITQCVPYKMIFYGNDSWIFADRLQLLSNTNKTFEKLANNKRSAHPTLNWLQFSLLLPFVVILPLLLSTKMVLQISYLSFQRLRKKIQTNCLSFVVYLIRFYIQMCRKKAHFGSTISL